MGKTEVHTYKSQMDSNPGVAAASDASATQALQRRLSVARAEFSVSKAQRDVQSIHQQSLRQRAEGLGSDLAVEEERQLRMQAHELQTSVAALEETANVTPAIFAEVQGDPRFKTDWRTAEAFAYKTQADPNQLLVRVERLNAEVQAATWHLTSAKTALAEEQARQIELRNRGAVPCVAAESRRERAEADVLNAMAKASQGDAEWPSVSSTEPAYARQLLSAKALLEQWHNQEIEDIKTHGRERCTDLSQNAAVQQARLSQLETHLQQTLDD